MVKTQLTPKLKSEIEIKLETLRDYFSKSYDQSIRSCEWDEVNNKCEILMRLALDIISDNKCRNAG